MICDCYYLKFEYVRLFCMLLFWVGCGEKVLVGDFIVVCDVWIREFFLCSLVVGYLIIENWGVEFFELIGVQIEVVERVEIYVMEDWEGRMMMRRIEWVAILVGSEVVFELGGIHLMLLGLY